MQGRVLDGKAISARIFGEVADAVNTLASRGRRPKLAAVVAGDASASAVYARSQQRHCEEVGIEYELLRLGNDVTQDKLCAHIRELNKDASVTGVMLLMPVPEGINASAAQYCIDPYKDVEGVNPANVGFVFYKQPILAPCAALAVVELIHESGRTVRGAEAVVVGQGSVVGRPITMFLSHEMATVTGCHIATKNLKDHTRRADILVVAVGKAGLIGAEHIKPGALVIDVGVNRVPKPDGGTRLVGDVRFDEVAEVAGVITPVPGGVGPVTVALLLRNTVEAAHKQMQRTGTGP